MIRIGRKWFAGLLAVLSGCGAFAADQGTRVSITATVVAPPPCEINDGRTIDVDFGQVGVKRIDGSRYMQRLSYSVRCEFLDPARQLKMKIVGTGAAFDANVLHTSVNGLGIKLLADARRLTSTARSISITPRCRSWTPYGQIPRRHADGRKFTSGATMQIDYF
ncbi:Minor fimbrial protein prsF precursor [Serratia rubidaea]|uniref:Minor fimbrial protein prsF n=1 Tax=Serratia rubidaea TaxID=61652 RepID=A0A447QLL5_SERRU|nr:Minor fimbrial protein prsF precursor [Serratia rubidaea]